MAKANKCSKCGSKEFRPHVYLKMPGFCICCKCKETQWFPTDSQDSMSRDDVQGIHDAGDRMMTGFRADQMITKIKRGY